MENKWLAIALAAAVAVGLAFVWYQVLFKKIINNSNDKSINPILVYGLGLIAAALVAYGLHRQIIGLHSYIISLSDDPTRPISEYPMFHGMLHGIQTAFYYGSLPALLFISLMEKKQWTKTFVHLGFWALAMTLMGGIVGLLG